MNGDHPRVGRDVCVRPPPGWSARLIWRGWSSGVLSWWHGVIGCQEYQSVLVDVSVGASEQDEYREYQSVLDQILLIEFERCKRGNQIQINRYQRRCLVSRISSGVRNINPCRCWCQCEQDEYQEYQSVISIGVDVSGNQNQYRVGEVRACSVGVLSGSMCCRCKQT